MNQVDKEIERLEQEIAEDEEALTAAQIRKVREREQELEWFEGLSDAERTELFRTAPETYRRALDAIRRRAESKLMGGAQ